MASSRISSFLLLAFVALILATAGPANAQLSVNFYATSAAMPVFFWIAAERSKRCQTQAQLEDIVVIAARDSVEALGGPVYSVPVGRRDATTANQNAANTQLPGFNENLDAITDKFTAKGFTQREMVALSGAHTVGQAQCFTFRDRIYGETNINATFQTTRQQSCPRTAGQGDGNLAPLDDSTPNTFDNAYFQGLINRRGLLHSDQVLFNGGATDSIVTTYSKDANTFSNDFANAMIKMGNLNPLTGTQGQVRLNCRSVN
ncbi:Peroxidase 72 [Nymphaea thermarum]|nr:Peroxidase 72 [Nymphaea thermarum]